METTIIVPIILVIILIETTYLVIKNQLDGRIFSAKSGRPVFVDTSALIDGRILALAKAGFIDRTLVIPRSVIAELQFMADQPDSDKRLRARGGLDIVAELQALPDVKVEIFPDERTTSSGVDNKLLELAKKHDGLICTLDFNLNKVAKTENIEVLNINDVAMNLRMAYLPGETTSLQLVQKGQERGQGVGYLADGTMVVVEQGGNRIGQNVTVKFTRSLQTEAGRMMFADLVNTTRPRPVKKPQSKDRSSNKRQENSRNKTNTKSRSYGKSGDQEERLVNLFNK